MHAWTWGRWPTAAAVVLATGLAGCSQLKDLLDAQVPVARAPVTRTVVLPANWTEQQSRSFHHVSQGTATLPVDYEWFLKLEQPLGMDELSHFTQPRKLLADPEYLRGWGFIDSPAGPGNPDGLPIGFARTPNFRDPARPGGERTALGFTCAACHTGQFTYRGTRVVIDGGASQANIPDFAESVGRALVEARLFPLTQQRFVERMLGPGHSAADRAALLKRMDEALALAKPLAERTKATEKQSVKEGYGRLDALNRIGNQVFSMAMPNGPAANFAPTNAPVSYPPIWSTSWFTWVQYDGSIMQPMVRNAGEALGVAAGVNLAPGKGGYGSTVNIKTLHAIETQIAGATPPQATPGRPGFTGLHSPKWPEAVLGTIDRARAERGRKLYDEQCAHCHLPAPDDPKFWSRAYWTDVSLADLTNDTRVPSSALKFLRVNVIPLKEIGTDPAQSDVLRTRTVDTTGLGIDTQVWTPDGRDTNCLKDPGTLVKDGPKTLFAVALGAVVQQTIDAAYRSDMIDPKDYARYNGERPNCLQAGAGYRARPLNGAWSTAPYLHNGSVATLYELLSPVAERRKLLWMGDLEYDPVQVGIVGKELPRGTPIDTSLPGNGNQGHEFTDDRSRPGRIGRSFTPQERSDLVEFLKTL